MKELKVAFTPITQDAKVYHHLAVDFEESLSFSFSPFHKNAEVLRLLSPCCAARFKYEWPIPENKYACAACGARSWPQQFIVAGWDNMEEFLVRTFHTAETDLPRETVKALKTMFLQVQQELATLESFAEAASMATPWIAREVRGICAKYTSLR